MNPIDTGSGVFPGGWKALPDGTWIAVHQKDDQFGVPTVWAQEAPNILGPYSEAVPLSSQSAVAAYDPGVVRFANGVVVATWWGSSISSYAIRLAPDVWSTPTILRKDKPLGFISDEQTVRKVRDHVWQPYNRKPKTAKPQVFDVVVRELGDGPTILSEQVVAASYNARRELMPDPLGTGKGPQGKQKRVTISDAGDGKSLALAWSRYAGEGDRPISIALSPDDGSSWGSPYDVFWAGQDLVNPFLINLGDPYGLRMFCSTSTKGLAHVTSIDDGASWSSFYRDPLDPDATTARIVLAQDGGKLYALCTTHDFTALGIVEVAI